MENTFTKDNTKAIKGVAILLMLMHHLWAFPDRLPGGQLRSLWHFAGLPAPYYLGYFANICISLFFFVGGYGLYVVFRGKSFDLVGRLKKLYIAYWKVFAIFIPIAFLFFRSQSIYCQTESICTKYAVFDLNQLLLSITGFNYSYNEEWWFFIAYVFALLTFPLARYVVEKKSLPVSMALVVGVAILTTTLFPALGKIPALGNLSGNALYARFLAPNDTMLPLFWLGILFARYDLLTRLRESLQKHRLLHPLLDVPALLLLVVARGYGVNSLLDVFFVPMMIVLLTDLLSHLRFTNKVLIALGEQSTSMWLLHSFFCYYFGAVAELVVAPRWSVPCWLLLVVLSYGAALIVQYFWAFIGKLKDRVACRLFPKKESA